MELPLPGWPISSDVEASNPVSIRLPHGKRHAPPSPSIVPEHWQSLEETRNRPPADRPVHLAILDMSQLYTASAEKWVMTPPHITSIKQESTRRLHARALVR